MRNNLVNSHFDPKKNLRARIQKKRDSLSAGERENKSKIITSILIGTIDFKLSKNILAYYPYRSEIDTTLIIKHALKICKNIILPRVNSDHLDLYFISELEKQLLKGSFGIMEPNPAICRKARIEDVELAIIPGVAFDRNLNRLGYGGGFYDRILPLLKKNIKKIGLCFDLQIVNELPIQEHDVKLDQIITEYRQYC